MIVETKSELKLYIDLLKIYTDKEYLDNEELSVDLKSEFNINIDKEDLDAALLLDIEDLTLIYDKI